MALVDETMPPLVDPGVIPAANSSSSMENNVIARSKSSNDLIDLKRRATSEVGNGTSTHRISYRRAESSAVCTPVTRSMEKFGSYIFDSFSKRQDPSTDSGSDQEPPTGVQDDDDSSTTSTVVHFDNSDFMPSNWTGAAEYIPPLGMAVVAGGLLFMAPIVFVGGILTACTALGAVHAAQASYERCFQGKMSDVYEDDKETSQQHQTPSMETSRNAMMQDKTVINMATVGDSSSGVKPEASTSSQATEVISTHSRLLQDPSMLETCEQALEWVNHYYPPLAFKNVDNLEFKGLNALEYFDVFLADDAPYTFEEIQKKRQDKNIRYGKWENLTGVTQPSLVAAAATIISPKHEEETKYHHHLKERVLNFDAKTNNGFLGPPYATTTKVQRCLVANKRLVVVESKTTMSNIPFSDRFYVLERWLITSQKRDDQYVSTMSVSCQVVFSKPCSFESFIVSKSQETVTEIAKKWNEVVQKALQRTEEARRERLQHDKENTKPRRHTPSASKPESPNSGISATPPDAIGPDSNIEVERIGRSSSRIMGEQNPIVLPIDPDGDGRPPTSGRKAAVRKSLGRSLSGLMKRRQSNPM